MGMNGMILNREHYEIGPGLMGIRRDLGDRYCTTSRTGQIQV